MKHGRMYVIYCYTNKINGKKYIGQTCQTLEERAGRDGYFYVLKDGVFGKAIQKYGWENFVPEILESGLTQQEANEREIYWIAELNTLAPFGYNLSKGGNSHELHELTKQKIGNSLRGKPKSEESKKKNSETHMGLMAGEKHWNYGNHWSEETRKKISESNKGHIPRNKGLPHTEETKRKISEAKKGKKPNLSEEQRKHLSEIHRGKKIPQKWKKVIKYSKDGEFLAEYSSPADASEKTGIPIISIYQCCKGNNKSAYGFIFKYKEVA